jgi:hypothetical protein
VTATLNFGTTPLTAVGTRYGRFRYTTAALASAAVASAATVRSKTT